MEEKPYSKIEEEQQQIKVLSEVLRQVFGENQDAQKFIDVSRIPLICQNITGIHTNLLDIKEMLDKKFVTKESFNPVKNVVYGIIGIVLTTAFVAILKLIIK